MSPLPKILVPKVTKRVLEYRSSNVSFLNKKSDASPMNNNASSQTNHYIDHEQFHR